MCRSYFRAAVLKRSEMRSMSLLLFVLLSSCSEAFKPVIIVHGLFDGPKDFKTLVDFIQKAHPGTEVTVLDLFDDLHSLTRLWTQVRSFKSALESRLNISEDGAHLLCFSQGGLICRALLSVMSNHTVHSFIALSAPLAGQYGATDYFKIFKKILKRDVYKLCYLKFGQDVSICQYWNDPHHRHSYLKHSNFLPLINGETPHQDAQVSPPDTVGHSSQLWRHMQSQRLGEKKFTWVHALGPSSRNNYHCISWRENFLRIRKLVLIGGPDDGVITPWQSSIFGFYDSRETVVPMRNQKFYFSDVFGLKTLDARGDLSVCQQSGVRHVHWHSNQTVFNNCIRDWLI